MRDGLRPFNLHWSARVGSTNVHAGVLRARGALFAPAVVLTARQTAGRGRGANTWWSGRGTLTVTFVLPADQSFPAYRVPLIAGLAVRNAAGGQLSAAGGHGADLRLKWPNDLVVGETSLRKLAGLLCQRIDGVDLVGLGINVNADPLSPPPAMLRKRIISLEELAGQRLDMNGVLIAIAKELHRHLVERRDTPFAAVLHEYDAHHALVGRDIAVDAGDGAPIRGRCEGLDATGRLLIRHGNVVERVISGQVLL